MIKHYKQRSYTQTYREKERDNERINCNVDDSHDNYLAFEINH